MSAVFAAASAPYWAFVALFQTVMQGAALARMVAQGQPAGVGSEVVDSPG